MGVGFEAQAQLQFKVPKLLTPKLQTVQQSRPERGRWGWWGPRRENRLAEGAFGGSGQVCGGDKWTEGDSSEPDLACSGQDPKLLHPCVSLSTFCFVSVLSGACRCMFSHAVQRGQVPMGGQVLQCPSHRQCQQRGRGTDAGMMC